MRVFRRSIVTILAIPPLFLAIFLAIDAGAQDRRNSQVGDLDIDQSVATDPVIKGREDSLAYFKRATEQLKNPSGTMEMPSETILNYLTGVYLYCTVNNGRCPIPLDALLDVDTMNAKSAGNTECTVLSAFWRMWIRGGMEERQQYLVKTGLLGTTSDFTKKERPRYVKCQETVAARLKAQEIPSSEAAQKLVDLIELIKERKINVLAEVGALESKEKPAAKGKGAKTVSAPTGR